MSTSHLVLVGSYAPGDEPGIHAFTFVSSDGSLVPTGSWSGVENPSYLTCTADGAAVFAVSETADGAVHGFTLERDGTTPVLVARGHRPSGGSFPCHVATSPDGRRLAVANYGSGSVTVLAVDREGGLGPTTASMQHEGSGPDRQRQDSPHAHSAVFAPGGRHLVAADLGADVLVVSELGADEGTVSSLRPFPVEPGAGPRHTAFHPDGRRLLCVNELDSTLAVHRWEGASGGLDLVASVSTLPEGESGPNLVAALAVSADGRHAYVSNRGHDSIAVIALEGAGPRRLTVRSCGGSWPRDIALAPDGGHLVVANERSDELVVLPVEDSGADIGAPVARVPVPAPTCVRFV